MAINAVAPWEGELIWKGEVNQYNNWKSIDFTLKYTNSKMEDEFITFNAFGEDKVNQILSFREGTRLKVVWWPKSNSSKSGDKWYSRNNAISIGLANPEAKAADTKVTAPSFPQQGTQLPKSEAWKNPYQAMPQQEEDMPDDDSNLPF